MKRIGFDPDKSFMDEENLNEKTENNSINFLKYIKSIIWVMILPFLVILTFVFLMVRFLMDKEKGGYKDDLALTREWIKEHERKI